MTLRIPSLSLLVVTAASLVGCSDDSPPTVDPDPMPPTNQVTVVSKVRPPPISGGTLLITQDGARALVSDPDRDRLVLVDLASQDVVARIPLQAGDEPGRAVLDDAGRAHVALRRGGAIVSIDLADGAVVGRRDVCGAPRGIAHFAPAEGGDATLIVACAGGELVELGAAPDSAILTATTIEPDLRDVVVKGDGTRAGRRLLVSSFRSAHVLAIGPDNKVERESAPSAFQAQSTGRTFSPTVAWRLVDTSDGALMIHQRSATVPIEIEPEQPDGYGGTSFDCGSTIVNAATTHFDSEGEALTAAQRGGVGALLLPVDVAVQPGASADPLVALIAAGGDALVTTTLSTLENEDGCDNGFVNGTTIGVGPEPIAVGFAASDVVVQLREPSMLVIYDSGLTWKGQIALGGERRFDSGHQLFHRNPEAPSTISCAACHPEGRDDSHTWQFTEIGARRTQSLEGGVMDSAPFHWDGDLSDMDQLMTTVFEHRMGGQPQSGDRVDALASWLDQVPRVAPGGGDAAAIARGKALFEDEKVGCASCHSGPRLTNDKTMDVGTGKAFQVPSLIGVRDRAPFMHDGCAETLRARFGSACGGSDHGDVSGLSDPDLDDLVAYMSSL